MNQNYITLVSPAGKFIFYSDVILSHAKLIRDAVTGQVLSSSPAELRIRYASDAPKYVTRHCAGSYAKDTHFSFIPA